MYIYALRLQIRYISDITRTSEHYMPMSPQYCNFSLMLWANGKVGIRFSMMYAHNKIISRYPISWNVAQGSKDITSYVRIRIVNILPYLWGLLIWKCFTKKKVQNQIEWHKHAVAAAAMHLTGQQGVCAFANCIPQTTKPRLCVKLEAQGGGF